MNTAPEKLEPYRRLLQKLGRMAEIARVLDLNRSDGEFCRREGGKLIYVFDTNVFQMFVQPYTYSRYVELFNADLWGAGFDRTVNRQAAMISSEHLFGGGLPHPVYKDIIISAWHHEELHEQIGILRDQIKETEQLSDRHEVTLRSYRRLHDLAELLRTRDEAQFRREMENFDFAAKMNDSLLVKEHASLPARIANYAITSICKLLVEDRYTEPAEQLVRLLSGRAAKFQPHTRVISLKVEDKELTRASEEWEKRLRAADSALKKREADRARRRTTPGAPYRGRNRNALQRDAKTLAWLDLVATRIPPEQRIVFVTGDRLLLNAYRRRRSDIPDGPFTIRSTLHYAPLLNLVDAKSEIGGDRPTPNDHFAQMRRALEQCLAFLNLSAHPDSAVGIGQLPAGGERDRFIADVEERDGDIMGEPGSSQRVISEKYYPHFFDPAWVEVKERELDAIAAPFKEVEGLAIGAFSDKVVARIEDNTALAIVRQWQREGQNSDLGLALSQAMNGLLHQVDTETMRFALNWAPEFIVTLLGSQTSPLERAVYRLRMEFKISENESEHIDAYIVRLADPNTENVRQLLALLRDDHPRLFALATVFAFRHERWRVAASYAELAAESADLTGDDLLRGEAHYLKATALRYQLASVAPNPDLSPVDRWRRWLTTAEKSHDICLAVFDPQGHPIRRLRTFSERAAARLSYVEWAAYGRLTELRENSEDIESFRGRLKETYLAALADLGRCRQILIDLGSPSENLGAVRLDHLVALEQHVLLNTAIAQPTGQRLADLELIDLESIPPAGKMPASIASERPSHQHPIYFIYEVMLRDAVSDDVRSAIELRVRELSLALDRAVGEYLLLRLFTRSDLDGTKTIAE